MLFNLSDHNSIANIFMQEIRDKLVQQDRMRFRRNMERLGEIMAYEISKVLPYTATQVETPLKKIEGKGLVEQPVIITILRAGLPYFQGFLNTFDRADAGFMGAYREENTKEISIHLDYVATPSLENRVVILVDPMLATGNSIISSLRLLESRGTPAHVHIASVIAAPEGIEFLKRNLSIPYTLWTCAVDEKLNDQFYIVPGLGDAGDLCYGIKV